MKQFKKKELGSTIAQAFESTPPSQPEVPPELTEKINSARQKSIQQKEFITELVYDVLVLFNHFTQGKYGTLSAIPQWKGAKTTFSLTLIPANIDRNNNTVIESSFDPKTNEFLSHFWEELQKTAHENMEINFIPQSAPLLGFSLTAPQPESLAYLIETYMENKKLSSLDDIKNVTQIHHKNITQRLTTFNEKAAASNQPLEEMTEEYIMFIPPEGLYISAEEAKRDAELTRYLLRTCRESLVQLSLNKLHYLSAQARGNPIPYQAQGYIIH